jgi:hypothetical protein
MLGKHSATELHPSLLIIYIYNRIYLYYKYIIINI